MRPVASPESSILDTESLLFEHFDDPKLEAEGETTALLHHTNLIGGWVVHQVRCSGKLDHYKQLRPLTKLHKCLPDFVVVPALLRRDHGGE